VQPAGHPTPARAQGALVVYCSVEEEWCRAWREARHSAGFTSDNTGVLVPIIALHGSEIAPASMRCCYTGAIERPFVAGGVLAQPAAVSGAILEDHV